MKLHRAEYTDKQWFDILHGCRENLPTEYADIFDREGEISEDYSPLFNIDLLEVSPMVTDTLFIVLRDMLEDKISEDVKLGDTTILAEILTLISIEQVVASI